VRGSLGLVIGVVVGAGAMYLVLKPPWGGHATGPVDAGQVATAPSDARPAGKPKKPRPHRHAPNGSPNVNGSAGGPVVAGGSDDQAWANQGDSDDTTTGPPAIQLGAADRALEWRGDDVSPPPRKIDMSSDARALDDNEIRSTIAAQSSAAQQCVVQGATNTDLKATITVKMVVDEHGRVTREKLQAPHYLFEHGLLACIRSALGAMHFPATGLPTLVTMPINLT
jgi:hypothetical protein